jgi:hypothetical protein
LELVRVQLKAVDANDEFAMINATSNRAHLHIAGPVRRGAPSKPSNAESWTEHQDSYRSCSLGQTDRHSSHRVHACDPDEVDMFLPQIEAEIVLVDRSFKSDERLLFPSQKAGKAAILPQAKRKVKRSYNGTLQGPTSNRNPLRQTQTISRHRNSLPQNCAELSGRPALWRHAYLVKLMTA